MLCCVIDRVVESILFFLSNEIIIHKSNQTINDLIRRKTTTYNIGAGRIHVLLRRDACIYSDPELPELLHLPAELLRPTLMADVVHVPHILDVLVLLLR